MSVKGTSNLRFACDFSQLSGDIEGHEPQRQVKESVT